MAKLIKGQAFTYGTKNDGTYLTFDVGSTGVNVRMYATEIRLSLESDNNTATNGNGEVISSCFYNHRKILNITGMISGTTDTNTTAHADATFGTVIQAGDKLDISSPDWAEIDGDEFIVQTAEKVRSNANYAEWSITAIEYIGTGVANDNVS